MTVYKLTVFIKTEVEAEVEHLAEVVYNEANHAVEDVEVLDWQIDDLGLDDQTLALLRAAKVL